MKKSLSTSVNPVSTPKKPENDPLIAPLLKVRSVKNVTLLRVLF